MIVSTEQFKDAASKVLASVDSNELSAITETLELKTENNNLYMNVTNKEYYVSVKLPEATNEKIHATVNANLFLKLVSQVTTSDIELNVADTNLEVKANGSYKLPLIFDGDKLLEMPDIIIDNKTVEMDIQSDCLKSILNYNSRELQKGTPLKPIQSFYYIDEKGAITFRQSACVNMFDLEKPVRMLLNQRIVKLFKLFDNELVHFTLGYDALTDETIQTKVSFETDNIRLTAIISCDDTMLKSMPVAAIRGRALNIYPYSVVVSKDALLQSINRLTLFGTVGAETNKTYSLFEFNRDTVTVWDVREENFEVIPYANSEDKLTETYKVRVDLKDVKSTLDNCSDQYVNINFGDSKALVFAKGNIYNVLPEVHAVR